MINTDRENQAARDLLAAYRVDSNSFNANDVRLAVSAVMILAVADYGLRMSLAQRVHGAVLRAKKNLFSGYYYTASVEAAILVAYDWRLSPVE